MDMPGSLLLELALRLVGATVLMLLAAGLLRGGALDRVYRSAGVLCISLIAFLLLPLLAGDGLRPLAIPTAGLAALAPVALWACAGAVFDDHFSLPTWAYPAGAAMAALGAVTVALGSGPAGAYLLAAQRAMMLAWLLAALFLTLRDWRGDLVAGRRQLRLASSGLLVLLIAALVAVQLAPGDSRGIGSAVALLLVASALGAAAHLLTLRRDNLFTRLSAKQGVPHQQLSPLAHRLQARMAEERLHATEGLTLQMLAEHLDVQPQRLRHVIHHELGHRSFSTFVNLHRVKEVASRLAEPEDRDTPLMTIARDAGFRSLTPLNRTFRAHYKVSPSSYREKAQRD